MAVFGGSILKTDVRYPATKKIGYLAKYAACSFKTDTERNFLLLENASNVVFSMKTKRCLLLIINSKLQSDYIIFFECHNQSEDSIFAGVRGGGP